MQAASDIDSSQPPAASTAREAPPGDVHRLGRQAVFFLLAAALFALGAVGKLVGLGTAALKRVQAKYSADGGDDASEPLQRMGYNRPLQDHDPELYELIELEGERQYRGLEMIASENFTSKAVLQCLGSVLTNKYAEGESGARYYAGNDIIDQVEDLCKARALQAYGLDPKEWAVNVQAYSGSPANFAVYTALVEPVTGRLMGLDLPDGGHLTHGYKTPSGKKISASSLYFDSQPYKVDERGYIDYEGMKRAAAEYKPTILIAGCSAYPRELDYAQFREAADAGGSVLLADMAHVSGLVAAGEQNNPFLYCDVVTTTTHKSLRGPRSGLIFSRRIHRDGTPTGWPERINAAVFPGLQGGPHEHQIAGVATQLKEVTTPEFKQYARQIKANARALAAALMDKGYKIMTDGTENHLLLWDLRSCNITGSKMERLLEAVGITANKNTLPGDKSALAPSGVRLGTPALTTRGLREADFVTIAGFLDEAVQLALRLQEQSGKSLQAFTGLLEDDAEVRELHRRVEAFAMRFPRPAVA